jgi:hypothetical protein
MKKLFGTSLQTYLAFAAAVLCACQATLAFADEISFVLDVKTGCKIFELNEADTSAAWSGACVNGKIEGSGTLLTKSKKTKLICQNVGDMKEGRMSGRTVATCSNGMRAEVDYTPIGGIVNGKGTLNLPNGDKYVGEFKGLSLHGQGKYTLADGTSMQVTFADNKRVDTPQNREVNAAQINDFVKDANTGCKIYKLQETLHAAKWSGNCLDEKISGSGVLVINFIEQKTSCTQTGEFKEGLKHGQMKISCTDGSSREGMYVNGIATGKGVSNGPEGDRWEGEYKDGVLNGQGTHTLAKLPKYKYQGAFKNNKYDGQGVQTFPDGEKRVGEFKDGEIIKGVATYPNNSKYEGEFKKEMPHGTGKFTYEFGSTYEGTLENGMYHGRGRLIYVQGDYQIGLFQSGKFITGTEKFSGTLAEHQRAEAEFKLEKQINNVNAWNRSLAAHGL